MIVFFFCRFVFIAAHSLLIVLCAFLLSSILSLNVLILYSSPDYFYCHYPMLLVFEFLMFLMVLAHCGLYLHVFDHFKGWAQVSQNLVCESDFCEDWWRVCTLGEYSGFTQPGILGYYQLGKILSELIGWHVFLQTMWKL